MSEKILSKIRNNAEDLKSNINSLNRSLDNLSEDFNTKSGSNSKKSAGPEPTHHELGTTDAPMNSEVNNYLTIQQDYLDNFKLIFEKVESNISDLERDMDQMNPEAIEMSSILNNLRGQIANIRDDFTFITSNKINDNQSEIMEFIVMRNHNIKKEDKEDFKDLLDKNQRMIKNLLKNTSSLIQSVDNVDIEDIDEEIKDTRQKRMEHEMEQMKPYMDLNRVTDLCKPGEKITVHEFCNRMTENSNFTDYSEDTAQDVLDNAVEASSDYNDINVIKNNNIYEIKKSD